MTKINKSPADAYVVKFLTTSRGLTPRFFELTADDPRSAVTGFRRLVPNAVVLDVYEVQPPHTWAER